MLIALGLAVLLWVLQLVFAERVVRAVPPLSRLPPVSRAEWPPLSVIVPARNEAAHLERALRSKLATGYPALEVVLVDDRSDDGTTELVDALAREDPRVRAAHVRALPAGWLGKVHAMEVGLSQATGEWILLSDADVHLAPGVLERVIAAAEAEGLDLIAVLPRMDPVSWVLDAGTTAIVRVLLLAGRAWQANDDRSKLGAGVGAFNLVRRRALDASPGLRGLRMEIADDVGLGLMLKAAGARCRLFMGREEVHLVFLDSLSAMSRSLEKGGAVLGFSWWRPTLAFALVVGLELGLPVLGIIVGGPAAGLGAAALLLATLVHLRVAWHARASLRGALLWPLGVLLVHGLTLRAGLLAWGRRGVRWRGTFYSQDTIERGRRVVMPSLRYRPPPSLS